MLCNLRWIQDVVLFLMLSDFKKFYNNQKKNPLDSECVNKQVQVIYSFYRSGIYSRYSCIANFELCGKHLQLPIMKIYLVLTRIKN